MSPVRKSFLGVHLRRLQKNGYIHVPKIFIEILRALNCRELILAPMRDCLAFIPDRLFSDQSGYWSRRILWDSNLAGVVSGNAIFPCKPLYQNELSSDRVRQAMDLLAGELKAKSKKSDESPRCDLERLVSEVFRALGMTAQLKIHISGAGVDLLLVEMDQESGKECLVVECEHGINSRQASGISDVLRLYGLSDALGRKGESIDKSVIVTSSGCSLPDFNFSKIFTLTSWGFDALVDWVVQNRLSRLVANSPVFQKAGFDSRGRIHVPAPLRRYLGLPNGGAVNWAGLGSIFELWSQDRYDKMLRLSRGDVDEDLEWIRAETNGRCL